VGTFVASSAALTLLAEKKLFTPFLQENAFASGAGLGLNMVQSLIKSMDGDIAIRSTLGQGTEVKVNLPVRMSRPRPPKTRLGPVTFYSSARDLSVLEAYSAASPRLGNAGLSSSAPPSFGPPRSTCRKLRVLVIDDNKISRKVLTTVMSRKGVDCREAEDGQEGLDIFQTWRPHLVFTDVSMPIMDGVELARRIRELERKEDAAHPTYIVALTGLSQSTVHEDLRGIDEWFTKGGQTTLKTLSNVVDRIQARIQDDGRTA
jgi:CheY-like chemotaxis protein